MKSDNRPQDKRYIAINVDHAQVTQGENIHVTGYVGAASNELSKDPRALLSDLSSLLNNTPGISDADRKLAKDHIIVLSKIIDEPQKDDNKHQGALLVNSIKGIVSEISYTKPLLDILNAIKMLFS